MSGKMRIIVFDGECNLCNNFINYLLKQDKKEQLEFASIGSTYATNFSENYPIKYPIDQSIIFINHDKVYYKSRAILEIISYLGGLYSLAKLLVLIPNFIRDSFYDKIAKKRHSFLNNAKSCEVYNKEFDERFLN
jgi:predicted DCC family thiol-disulfide oxidoreductase YuxK